MKTEIITASAKLGPYSAAVETGGMLYTSGQLGIDPETGEFAAPDAAGQAVQALKNLRDILTKAGKTMDDIVKTTIFLADMGDFAAVNAVYEGFFTAPYPARTCVQAAALPKAARVEIEAIANFLKKV